MKTCNKCKKIKPYDCFNKNNGRKDGLQTRCKECFRLYQKDKRDRINEVKKEYRRVTRTLMHKTGQYTLRDNKHCHMCKTTKPIDSFSRDGGSIDGHDKICKACQKRKDDKRGIRVRDRWRENPHLSKDYKIEGKDRVIRILSRDDFTKMLSDQEDKCKICRSSFSDFARGAAVDHDHKTGLVRGLLCMPCNVGLGSFRDNPEHLKQAIEYLTARPLDN